MKKPDLMSVLIYFPNEITVEYTAPTTFQPEDFCKKATEIFKRLYPTKDCSYCCIGINCGTAEEPYVMGHTWLTEENRWAHKPAISKV